MGLQGVGHNGASNTHFQGKESIDLGRVRNKEEKEREESSRREERQGVTREKGNRCRLWATRWYQTAFPRGLGLACQVPECTSFQVLKGRGYNQAHIVQDAYLPFLCPASNGWELRGCSRSLRRGITETVLKKTFFFFFQFTKATEKPPQTIYRNEYIPFPGHRPDQISRWYSKRRVEVRGLRAQHSAWPLSSAQETLNNQTLSSLSFLLGTQEWSH